MDSVFIAGGIHADELKVSKTSLDIDQEVLQELVELHNARPQYFLPFLR